MADIHGATSRQLYDMLYRMVNQPAQVHSTGGTVKGRLGSPAWDRKSKDGTLHLLSVEGRNGDLSIPLSTVMRIELIQN